MTPSRLCRRPFRGCTSRASREASKTRHRWLKSKTPSIAVRLGALSGVCKPTRRRAVITGRGLTRGRVSGGAYPSRITRVRGLAGCGLLPSPSETLPRGRRRPALTDQRLRKRTEEALSRRAAKSAFKSSQSLLKAFSKPSANPFQAARRLSALSRPAIEGVPVLLTPRTPGRS